MVRKNFFILILLFLISLVFGLLIILRQKSQSKSSLSTNTAPVWQTYSDENFSFKYPGSWTVKSHKTQVVIKSNNNYIYFDFIEKLVGNKQTKSIKEYLLKEEQQGLEKIHRTGTMMPLVPGYTQYKAEVVLSETFPNLENTVSIVEVYPYGTKTYYLIKDYRVYRIHINENHAVDSEIINNDIKQILKTLKVY